MKLKESHLRKIIQEEIKGRILIEGSHGDLSLNMDMPHFEVDEVEGEGMRVYLGDVPEVLWADSPKEIIRYLTGVCRRAKKEISRLKI